MALKTVWFLKGSKLNDEWLRVSSFSSDKHPKPSLISEDDYQTDEIPFSSTSIDQKGNLVISINDEKFSGLENIWFLLDEKKIPTPMYAIHGVFSKAFPAGTLVRKKDLDGTSITQDQLVGFVRWFKSDSRLQQVFVSENWRRKNISSLLIYSADIAIIAGEMGPYLNGGDITTSDGEKLRQAWSESLRVTPRMGSVQKYQ